MTTTVNETVNFSFFFIFTFNYVIYTQDLAQISSAQSDTKQQLGLLVNETQKNTVYPFTFNYNSVGNPDGSGSLSVSSYQQDFEYEQKLLDGFSYYSAGSQEVVKSSDQYTLNTAGAVTTRSIDSSAQYQSTDTLGHCYSRALTANNLALATVTDGAECGGTNKP